MDAPPRSAHAAAALLYAAVVASALAFSFRLTSFALAKEAVLLALLLPLPAFAAPGALRAGFAAFAPWWGGLAAAAGLAALRVPVPALAVEEAGRIAVLLFAASLAHPLLHRAAGGARVRTAIAGAAACAGAAGVLQYYDLIPFALPDVPGYDQPVYSVFGNQDLFGGYLAIGLAAALHGARRTPWPWFAIAPMLWGLAICGSRSAWLAAAAGAAAALAPGADRRARTAALLAAAAMLAALPYAGSIAARAAGSFGPEDVGGRARLWFWDGTLRMIADAPLLGHGLGQYPYLSPRYLGDALAAPGGSRHYRNTLHTGDAHNAPLELAAETGLAGLGFGLWLLVRGVRGARGAGAETGWAIAAIAAFCVFALFNGATRSPPHAFAALLALGALAPPRTAPADAARWPGVRGGVIAAGAALMALRLWTALVPSALLTAAEDAHLRGVSGPAAYGRALAYPWPAPSAHEGLAIALAGSGDCASAVPHLEAALSGLDTGRVHLLLGECLARLGRMEEARAALGAALQRWPSDPRALGSAQAAGAARAP